MQTIKLKDSQLEILLRYSLMLVLAVLIAHYISYQKLPFLDQEYSFPLRAFIIVSIFGVVICETNTFIYSWLNKKKPFSEKVGTRLVWQYGLTLGSTFIVFSFLYTLINILIFGQSFDFFTFSFYLGICLFISAFEATIYTARELYKSFRKQKKLFNIKVEEQNGNFQFKVATRTYNLRYSEIAYIHSSGGIVILYDKSGKKYITNFTSFNEISPLPTTQFFRINRQMIINRQIVKSFETTKNRKNKLYLQKEFMNGFEEIIISRYKFADFKKWYSFPNNQPIINQPN